MIKDKFHGFIVTEIINTSRELENITGESCELEFDNKGFVMQVPKNGIMVPIAEIHTNREDWYEMVKRIREYSGLMFLIHELTRALEECTIITERIPHEIILGLFPDPYGAIKYAKKVLEKSKKILKY